MLRAVDAVDVACDYICGSKGGQQLRRRRHSLRRGFSGFAELLKEILAVTAGHDDIDFLVALQSFRSHRRDKLQTAIACNFRFPGKSESTGGSDTDTNTGKAARADIDHDAVGAPAIGQVGNEWKQPFGVAATNDFMVRGDKVSAIEQRDRASLCGSINYKRSHRTPLADYTMLLKRPNSGRGLRSKMLAGSP